MKTTPRRDSTLDILKGFSLLGLLLSHYLYGFTTPPLVPDPSAHQSITDLSAVTCIDFFVSGQGSGCLAFFLGIEFFIISDRVRETQWPQHLRRYLFLLLAGIIHQLIWPGDVLVIYALAGLLLCLLEKQRPVIILLTGVFFLSNLPGFFAYIYMQFVQGLTVHSDAIRQLHLQLMEKGSAGEFLAFHLLHFTERYKAVLYDGQLFRMAGFMVLGLYAGRARLLQRMNSQPRPFGVALLACTLFFLCLLYLKNVLNAHDEIPSGKLVQGMVSHAHHVLGTTCFILAGILLLGISPVKQALSPVASTGKIWLSVYLFQTLTGLLLFYPFGLGLFGHTGYFTNVMLAAGVFIIQVVFCRIWMRFFYTGPAEWLWRSFTAWRRRRFYRFK